MKVRVKAEFKDKHTGEIHKIGKELELSVQRINEIIQVGNLIELVEQTEQLETKEESPEPDEQAADQEEKADAGEQAEETPKQTGRRKRTK